MRKDVCGRMLSVVLAAALVFTTPVTAFAGESEIVVTSEEETILLDEGNEEASEELLIEEVADPSEDLVEVPEEETICDTETEEEVTEAQEETVQEEDFLDEAEEFQTESTSVQKLPKDAVKVGDPEKMGVNVWGQLYKWTSEGKEHLGLYFYEQDGPGYSIDYMVSHAFVRNNYDKITDVIFGFEIKEIGSRAFDDLYSLSYITLPQSLKKIGRNSFENCTSLTSITIPKNVKEMGSSIFAGCSNLTTVTFEEGMKEIPDSALSIYTWEGYVTTVNIPSTITKIGEYAFYKQTRLKNVNFTGNAITSIEKCAFSETGIEDMVLPNSITNIGEMAFCRDYTLKTLKLPSSLTTLGNWAFSGCTKLKTVTIPKSVTKAGYETFDGCSSLTSVIFEEGIPTIPANICATTDQGSLLSVTIPASVTAIGEYAFCNQTALKEVKFAGTKVKSIGKKAFYNTDIRTVYYKGSESSRKKISIGEYNEPLLEAEWLTQKDTPVVTMKKVQITLATSEVTFSESGNELKNYSLSYQGKKLEEGTDYVVSYKNTNKAGKAQITFKGIEAFSGSVTKTYVIKKCDISGLSPLGSDGKVIADQKKFAYMKGGVKPAFSLSGIPASAYKVSYKNNKKVTTDSAKKKPLMKITGKGNYTGTIEISFVITQQNIKEMSVAAADVVASASPNKFARKPVITDKNGKKLVVGTDYEKAFEYTYVSDTTVKVKTGKGKKATLTDVNRKKGDKVEKTDIIPAGTEIRITVTGKGAYVGTADTTYFVINK